MNSQQKRVSPDEQALLQTVFKDRDDLLLLLRNLFFGFELDEGEKQVIKNTFSQNANLRRLMRKMILPELQKDIPIGQSVDLWMTVQVEGKDSEQIQETLVGRQVLIESLEIALKLLEDVEGKKVNPNNIDVFKIPYLYARNGYITYIEGQLLQIRQLANEKKETPEDKKKRIKKDSSQ